MLTVAIGLSSALGYALHDFLMVKVVRVASVWTGLAWSMGVGLAILLPLALALHGLPSGSAEWRAVGFAVASGLCEAAGLACLLRGLVVGSLSVVTPLASLSGGFVAVIVIARGESLTALALVGLPLAVVGGLMASIERAPKEEVFDLPSGPPPSTAAARVAGGPVSVRRTRATAGAGWALASALIFSVAVLLIAEATALRPVALAAWGRLGTVALLVPVAMLLGGLRLPRPLVARSAYAGVFDAAAFVALAAAIAIGPVAVASVVVSQVGTMAAVLGLLLLRERLSTVQYVGVALTGVAVAILSVA